MDYWGLDGVGAKLAAGALVLFTLAGLDPLVLYVEFLARVALETSDPDLKGMLMRRTGVWWLEYFAWLCLLLLNTWNAVRPASEPWLLRVAQWLLTMVSCFVVVLASREHVCHRFGAVGSAIGVCAILLCWASMIVIMRRIRPRVSIDAGWIWLGGGVVQVLLVLYGEMLHWISRGPVMGYVLNALWA